MKRMLALVLCLGLANVARAEDVHHVSPDSPIVYCAADAPASPDCKKRVGEPVLVPGVLLPDALAVRRAKELTALRTENEALKAAPAGMPVGLVVLLVVAGVVAGGAAGYGVAKAVK